MQWPQNVNNVTAGSSSHCTRPTGLWNAKRGNEKPYIEEQRIQYNTIQYNTIQYNTMANKRIKRQAMVHKTI
jgi:hypothetical protein